jgi:hypothetical protein
MDYTKEFHALYEKAKELVDKNILDVGDKITNISGKEEKDFYVALHDFFLQKRQREVIAKGLF